MSAAFRTCVTSAWLLLALGLLAQPEHTNWFFGSGAGISFAGGSPVAFTGSAINSFEGCASISDPSGDPLFYCDGVTVYDALGVPMPNGTGMAGSTSSCQGVLIVPVPGDPRKYYVFLVPSQIGQTSTFDFMSWSVVDMDLNGGYGDVTEKNMPLLTHATEQLAAAYHANGRDVWVLTRLFGTEAWYAYLVTCAGIAPPVVSNAGQAVRSVDPIDTQAALGWMDISGDGTRIASIWNDYPGGYSYLELLDFDAATGVVSNGSYTTHPSPGGSNTGYGVCISAGGHALYWSEYGAWPSRLWQFDLEVAAPLTTGTVVGEGQTNFGGLQNGPDGKVYLSRWDGSQYIARVDAPEVIGPDCGFVYNGVLIAPGYGSLCLSNDWMAPRTPVDLIAWTDTTTCRSSIDIALTHLFADPQPQVVWSTGAQGASITVNTSGTYTVMAFYPCDTLFDTVHVELTPPYLADLLGADSAVFCSGEELTFRAPDGFAAYLWSTGSTEAGLTTEEPGTLWLEVSDASGCAMRDSVQVVQGPCACDLYLPNVFSPNLDGINEWFAGVTTCAFDAYVLTVFNRWGQVVFEGQDADQRWSGNDHPEGVYVWSARYAIRGQQQRTRYGTVTLLR